MQFYLAFFEASDNETFIEILQRTMVSDWPPNQVNRDGEQTLANDEHKVLFQTKQNNKREVHGSFT